MLWFAEGEKMDINVVCSEQNVRRGQISKAIGILNSVQNYFYFILELDKDMQLCEKELINWGEFRENYPVANDKYSIYITEKAFDDNWFSHEEFRFAVISTDSWEEIFAPPSLKAYLVYQIAQAVINFEADLNETMEMKLVHDYAEGCMFDLCTNKEEIKLGMMSGVICPKCRSTLIRYGVDQKAIDAVEKMIAYVRSEAIGKPMLFNEKEAFIVMRFSANDENDNAYKYGIKTALEALHIKCVRADNNINSGQLLEKIRKGLERSRFIIAKVDSDNLNVYFELGLAMGLNKDVLLVSDKELVLQLPSDLRNWECLTYSKGNYDELKEKVMKYYQENYHFK